MKKNLKVKLVTFEDGIVCIGFRRISSFLKSQFPDVSTYIYNVSGIGVHLKNIFYAAKYDDVRINDELIEALGDADVVGLSGMSKFARHISVAIEKLRILAREKNINMPFIIWGGIHATVFPQDAIQYVDAVCIGEGELACAELLKRMELGLAIDDTPSFWIRKGDRIIKNPCIKLMGQEQLSHMPFQDYGFDIYYATHKELARLDKKRYFYQMGSKYTTMWSLGCPFHCTYCSNSRFIANNPENARIRYPAAEHIIEELILVTKEHEYIQFIEFEDDNFMLIEDEDIRLFCELYAKYVKLPFFVAGIHPLTLDRDKISMLLKAGMRKVRMGIQTGSEHGLSFYGRNTPTKKIIEAVDYLSSLYPRIVPPFYDIILDNPVESEKDKMETISLLYQLSRPFFLYIYSLRIIPGTSLYDFAEKNPKIKFIPVEKSYQLLADARYAFLAYLLALCRPPLFIFKMALALSRYNLITKPLLVLIKIIYIIKRGYWEMRISNLQPLCMLSPGIAYFLYSLKAKDKKSARMQNIPSPLKKQSSF